ncbi:MAG: hypothetical protein FWF77_00165 [Defluviitaleaceae bacterium]|nr:hypothetical protein [Defluviitaleaceae bacterium]
MGIYAISAVSALRAVFAEQSRRVSLADSVCSAANAAYEKTITAARIAARILVSWH